MVSSRTRFWILDQQEAEAAVLAAIEPDGAGEDEDGKVGGHGRWYERAEAASLERPTEIVVTICTAMNCDRAEFCDIRADHIIADCINPDRSDAEVVAGLPAPAAVGEMEG